MNAKTRNTSIDIFRYICALLVLAIHTSVLSDISEFAGHIIKDVIAQMAVPFFFAISGYYFIQKLESNEKVFKKYVIRLLKSYAIWSAIYFIADFIRWGYLDLKGYVVTLFYTFFLTGSHYHLWFMLALIYCVCSVTLMYKLNLKKLVIPLSIVLLVLGCLGGAYYGIGDKIPVLKTIYNLSNYHIIRHFPLLSFPFFACGSVIYKIQTKFSCIKPRITVLLVISSVIFWMLEVFIVNRLGVYRDGVMTLGLYPVIISLILCLLKYPMMRSSSVSKAFLIMANFTYYAHPILLEIFDALGLTLMPTLRFVIVAILAAAFGFGIFKANNKYLSSLA